MNKLSLRMATEITPEQFGEPTCMPPTREEGQLSVGELRNIRSSSRSSHGWVNVLFIALKSATMTELSQTTPYHDWYPKQSIRRLRIDFA